MIQMVTPTDAQKMIQHFQEYFTIYEAVLPYLGSETNKKLIIEQKRDWMRKLRQTEFPVAFLGSYSAGKSTMINAILGREILPATNQPTTAFPTLIKKGQAEKAVIYFMDEQARLELWDSFVSDIEKKIGQNLQRQEAIGKHFMRIKEAVQIYQQDTEVAIDQQALIKLQALLSNWGNDAYKGIKEVTLSELRNYVEGYVGAIYVDKIEVFLENLNLGDDIVLVDLPGLSVDNKRHEEFTKSYIKEKAKAFVVCSPHDKVLQGKEIEFLSKINQQNSTIIERAFWVINKWDAANSKLEQTQSLDSFKAQAKTYSFSINAERQFQTSAFNYLLLKLVSEGTIDESPNLKEGLGNLIKSGIIKEEKELNQTTANSLLNHPDIITFSQFIDSLFNYLNQGAKDEFIDDAKKELLQIIRILDGCLKPLDDSYSESTNPEEETKSVEINKKLRSLIEQLKQKAREFSQEIRTTQQSSFWQESDTKAINQELSKKIQDINRLDLLNEISTGVDMDYNLAELPYILDKKLELTLLMRKRSISVIDSFFIQRLSKLLTALEIINPEYLPEEMMEKLEDKLCERDISMRLSGLADALFYQYGSELQRIGLNLKDCQEQELSESDKLLRTKIRSDKLKEIEKVLQMYQTKLEEFIETIVIPLNQNIRRTLENHTEDLEKELLELFDNYQDEITKKIARNINLDAVIIEEVTKQKTITDSYVRLVNLRRAILENPEK